MSEGDGNTMRGVKAQTDMGWKGEGPWTYTRLHEPYLTAELDRQALPKTYELGVSGKEGTLRKAFSVSLQPCPDPDQRSQDRNIVESWELPNGKWTFVGVFDGHAGHDTVDHTVKSLPSFLKRDLESGFSSQKTIDTEVVTTILSDSIRRFDDNMTRELMDLFPGGEAAINKMSDEEIKGLINDQQHGGTNATIVARCMRGTTVLIALVDPGYEDVWVASLGDCVAILGEVGHNGSKQSQRYQVMSKLHNGDDAVEAVRVQSEHPDEDEAFLRRRVLGAIAVTRALGDHLFKLPKPYTERIFMNASSGFRFMTPLSVILPRIKTPPYLSNVPEVEHISFGTSTVDSLVSRHSQRFLILCSDGLIDLFKGRPSYEDWIDIVGNTLCQNKNSNAASALLRYALGGTDEEVVSSMLTVEMCERWMDDTTIIVLPL